MRPRALARHRSMARCRIQYAQPVLNHDKWEQDHQKNTEYLKRKIEFPLIIRTPRKAPLSARLAPIEEAGLSVTDGPLSARNPRRNMSALKLVFGAVSNLEDKPYALEMSTDDRGTLYVTAHDPATNNTLELMVTDKVHRKLFKDP